MSLNTAIVVSGRDRISGQPVVDSISQWSELPMDVARIIFQNLQTDLPTLAFVCRNWKAITDDEVFRQMIRPAQAFGTKEWQEYIGVDAGEELRLPRCAYGDLQREEGMLTFIPEKVKATKENGVIEEVPLDNLEAIGKLVENPKKGNKTAYTSGSWKDALKEKRQGRNRIGSG